ncbi:MAG: DUF86 domain-containing protein [Acidobacteria bacterium]|nr:DUF86 domain-containing protein [Acidobacteriota bacterium]MBI3657107.1 DUF86 domain-containing protein [Acidobacteriota bacterium]
MRDDRVYLQDILEAIERIEKYAARGRQEFDRDELIQTWVIYYIQIIGEATRKLSQGFRAKHPEIPWQQIAAMRNILVHDYFQIDVDEVWSVVETDLPGFRKKMEAMFKELDSSPS